MLHVWCVVVLWISSLCQPKESVVYPTETFQYFSQLSVLVECCQGRAISWLVCCCLMSPVAEDAAWEEPGLDLQNVDSRATKVQRSHPPSDNRNNSTTSNLLRQGSKKQIQRRKVSVHSKQISLLYFLSLFSIPIFINFIKYMNKFYGDFFQWGDSIQIRENFYIYAFQTTDAKTCRFEEKVNNPFSSLLCALQTSLNILLNFILNCEKSVQLYFKVWFKMLFITTKGAKLDRCQ